MYNRFYRRTGAFLLYLALPSYCLRALILLPGSRVIVGRAGTAIGTTHLAILSVTTAAATLGDAGGKRSMEHVMGLEAIAVIATVGVGIEGVCADRGDHCQDGGEDRDDISGLHFGDGGGAVVLNKESSG